MESLVGDAVIGSWQVHISSVVKSVGWMDKNPRWRRHYCGSIYMNFMISKVQNRLKTTKYINIWFFVSFYCLFVFLEMNLLYNMLN